METNQIEVTKQNYLEVIASLVARVDALEQSNSPKSNEPAREMTDDDARSVLNGECASLKHKEAAEKLGLSYGQVYSCRGEYTFKAIHKELRETGWKNGFKK